MTLLSHDGKERVTRINEFSVVKQKFVDDMILRWPALFQIQSILSTIHGTVKFITKNGSAIVTALNT